MIIVHPQANTIHAAVSLLTRPLELEQRVASKQLRGTEGETIIVAEASCASGDSQMLAQSQQ